MARYRAIFLDAGFTLLEMHPSWTELFLRVTRSHGLAFSPADVDRADAAAQGFFDRHYYQPNDTWADDAAITAFWLGYYHVGLRAIGCPEALLEPCAQDLTDLLNQDTAWKAYTEVPQALADLKTAGYTIGILSDWGKSLPHILEAAGLRTYADFLVVSAIEGVAKPRPAFFQRALDRAGVPPHQALMVGDNLYADIQGAAGIGVAGVLIDRPGRYKDGSVSTIRRLDELERYLNGAPDAQPR
jgi:putative hydrolase of the HAD superfamily